MIGLQQRLIGCGKTVYWQPHDIDRIARHYGVKEREIAFLPMQHRDSGGQSFAGEPTTRSSDKITGPFDFYLTTETLDSYGDVVKNAGILYRRFDRNPIALGYHQGSFPIGTWSNRRNEGTKLRASLNFSNDHNAQRIARLVNEGVLRGCSIGFLPVKWEFSKDTKRPFGIDFHEIELCEASVVGIPAVPDALLAAMPAKKAATLQARRYTAPKPKTEIPPTAEDAARADLLTQHVERQRQLRRDGSQ